MTVSKRLLRILDSGRGFSEEELSQLEKDLKFTFPKDIRLHFSNYSGGYPERCIFKFHDEIIMFQEFIDSIEGFRDTFYNLKIDPKLLPDHLIPFANDPGGYYFCFSVNPETRGYIYFWRSEYYDDESRAFSKLANSLDELLLNMIDEDEVT